MEKKNVLLTMKHILHDQGHLTEADMEILAAPRHQVPSRFRGQQ